MGVAFLAPFFFTGGSKGIFRLSAAGSPVGLAKCLGAYCFKCQAVYPTEVVKATGTFSVLKFLFLCNHNYLYKRFV